VFKCDVAIVGLQSAKTVDGVLIGRGSWNALALILARRIAAFDYRGADRWRWRVFSCVQVIADVYNRPCRGLTKLAV